MLVSTGPFDILLTCSLYRALLSILIELIDFIYQWIIHY